MSSRPLGSALALAVSLGCCTSLAAAAKVAPAEAPDGQDSFSLGPANYERLMAPEVFTSWNGGATDAVLKPGPKIMFFGEARGCPVGRQAVRGGPVYAESLDGKAAAPLDTGLPAGRPKQSRRWSPSFDLPECNAAVRGARAGSYVQLNTDPVEGGVGLYTAVGPDADGRAPVFGPYGPGGQGGSGANAHIEGSFLSFRQAWFSPQAIKPWHGAGSEMQLLSLQGVSGVSLGPNKRGSADVTQAKQQISVSVINPLCLQQAKGSKRLCQFQYLFNTAVFRTGVSDWGSVAWFQQAGLMHDPAQGGVAVIHGPIGNQGVVTRDQDSGLALYRSEGVSSQHQVFSPQTFDIRISWEALLNAQRLIVGAATKQKPQAVSDADLAAEFGPSWHERSAWVLLNVQVAQEVYDPDEATRSFIGGAVKSLAVRALDQRP